MDFGGEERGTMAISFGEARNKYEREDWGKLDLEVALKTWKTDVWKWL